MKLSAVSQRVVEQLDNGKQLKINVGDVARLRTNRHAYRSLRIDKGESRRKKREAHFAASLSPISLILNLLICNL
ncbi:MAG: hypothetical protein LUC49_05770 [Prevotella sp.]|nr:hypothetical protein [Prevotella sp.]